METIETYKTEACKLTGFFVMWLSRHTLIYLLFILIYFLCQRPSRGPGKGCKRLGKPSPEISSAAPPDCRSSPLPRCLKLRYHSAQTFFWLSVFQLGEKNSIVVMSGCFFFLCETWGWRGLKNVTIVSLHRHKSDTLAALLTCECLENMSRSINSKLLMHNIDTKEECQLDVVVIKHYGWQLLLKLIEEEHRVL